MIRFYYVAEFVNDDVIDAVSPRGDEKIIQNDSPSGGVTTPTASSSCTRPARAGLLMPTRGVRLPFNYNINQVPVDLLTLPASAARVRR